MDTHDKTLNPDPVNTFLDNTPDSNVPPLFTQIYSKKNIITTSNFTHVHEVFIEDNIDLKRVTPNIIENEVSYETTTESDAFVFRENSETYGVHSIFKFKDSDANNANIYTRTLHYYVATDPKTKGFIGNKFDYTYEIQIIDNYEIKALFIANDIEKVFGKLENKQEFVRYLEKSAELSSNQELYNKTISFETETDTPISISIQPNKILILVS
jgi:hypothetical protein